MEEFEKRMETNRKIEKGGEATVQKLVTKTTSHVY
jgi:hypothetical protein